MTNEPGRNSEKYFPGTTEFLSRKIVLATNAHVITADGNIERFAMNYPQTHDLHTALDEDNSTHKQRFSVDWADDRASVFFQQPGFEERGEQIVLSVSASSGGQVVRLPSDKFQDRFSKLPAVIEALTSNARNISELLLEIQPEREMHLAISRGLLRAGLRVNDQGQLRISPEQFWQIADFWLVGGGAGTPYPEFHIVTGGRRHPCRRPKPAGVVYRRFIPWLRGCLSFRVADPNHDLATFSRWMNDPRIANFFEDQGPLEKHGSILEARKQDPHLLPLIGEFEGTPFGYFEVYWAKENRLGPHYDCDDYDRGWHVAIGEDAFRGKEWIVAWLPSLMHYIFLDDSRTQRIVGEPRASHHQQIRNLDKSGFAKVKHFDFPHKRALLVMLLRERFFGDRLWAPEAPAP